MATDLKAWRGRNDDGTETTATWKAAQNTSWTQVTNTNFRIRFLHQQSAALVNNLDVQLQYSLDNSVWTNVSASSLVIRSSASANLADAANLTSQLTGGTGTFIGATCFDEVNGICGGTSLDVTATGNFETEFSVQLRDADVFHDATVYIRTINSDTATAWNTYSGGVASLTVSGTRKAAAPGADALGSYADSAPTIDKQDLAGTTPITSNVPADAWGTLADSIIAGIPRQGWGDAASYDRQDTTSPNITKNIAADSLNNWAERLGLGISLSGDGMAMGDVAAIAARYRLGWLDATAYDRQALGAPTAITRDVPADSLGLYADQTPLIDERGILTAAITDPNTAYGEQVGLGIGLFGDSMPLADQAPTIDRRGILTATPAADSLGLYADQTPLFDKPVISTTPITVAVPADSLGLYADQAPTFYLTGNHLIAPSADSLGLYADQQPTIDERGFITIAPSTDSLGLYADLQPTIDERGFLTAALAADSLGLYADQIPVISKIAFLTANVAADSLGLYADQTPIIDKPAITTTPIAVTPPADSLGLYADQPAVFYKTGAYAIAPAADSLGLYADSAPLIDERGFLSAAPPTDSLANYAEQFGLAYLNLSDSLGLYADQAPTIDKRGYLTAAPAADSLGLYADQTPLFDKPVIGTTPIVCDVPADSLGLYADQTPIAERRRLGWQDQVSFVRPVNNQVTAQPPADSLGLYADQTPPLFIGYRAGYPLFLVDEGGNYLVDGNGNPFVIAGLVDTLNQFGDSAAINLTSLVTAITRNVPADANIAYSEALGLGIGLLGDSMAMADQTAIIAKTALLSANVAADSLGLYADLAPTIDRQIITTTPISVTPSADSLGLYADQAPGRFETMQAAAADSLGLYADQDPTTFETLRSALTADSLGLYADQAPIVSKVAALTANVPADSLGLYGDQAPTTFKIANLTTTPAADSLGLYADQAAKTFESYSAQLADSLGLYADLAPFTFATFKVALPIDSIPSYFDYAQAVTITGAQVVYPLRLESEIVDSIGLQSEFISTIELESEVVNIIPLFSEIS